MSTLKRKKILIAAGGSGGHLIPAQQLAEQLEGGAEVIFAGFKLAQSPYFQQKRFAFHEIVSSPRLWNVATLSKGVCQSIALLVKEKPDVVVGFGSYHSAPVLLAAALSRQKIALYEANSTLGKVNRWIGPFARCVAHQFPLDQNGAHFVPVQLFPWKPLVRTDRKEAAVGYGLDPARLTLLVFGGSQGAAFLNETMPDVAAALGCQVIHFAGSEAAAEAVREKYRKKRVRAAVKAFEREMHKGYAAADFVVCRSGAGTVAELIRYEVPALLVPYPFAADGHQQENAANLCRLGGALRIDQKEAGVLAIVEKIKSADAAAMRFALRAASGQNDSRKTFHQLVSEL